MFSGVVAFAPGVLAKVGTFVELADTV